jgi:periplasmic divalent cation tolerance protein
MVFSTCPDEAVAARIARTLVEERLAACVNRVAAVRSTYAWEGAIQDDAEVLLVIKTRPERFEALAERLKGLHPYELPEIVAVPVVAGSAPYLAWLTAGT